MRRSPALALLLLACPLAARAHDSGAVYLTLQAEGADLRGELDLVLPDALALLGLPLDLPEPIAWTEIEQRADALAVAVERGVRLADRGGDCAFEAAEPWLSRPEEPGLVELRFVARCAAPLEEPSLDYSLLLDLDPAHRAFVALRSASGELHSTVVDLAHPHASFDLRPVSAWSHFPAYLREGARHVSTGLDHLLFLAALLLPAAHARVQGRWVPRDRARDVVIEVAGVVSAFTVAHSLTLCLAALEVVRLPSRGVETAIALSVLVAALNNVGPLVRARAWQLAFGFGLVHGFGFAAQLGILGLPPAAKGVALLGFNLGVEVGQLAAASVCLPLVLALRRRSGYRTRGIELPSIAIAWLAAVWLVERAFGITLLGWGS